MAVDDTPAAPEAGTYDPATLNTIIQRLMQQPAPPQPVAQPSSTEGRGALSLLGEAIGGGEQYGTTQQREAAGLRALQSMGMNMMANSGYAPVRTPFGQILASGMQGAQQSLGESQSVEAAQMGAQQQYAEKQQEMQLERLKAVLPLLQLQGRQGLPSPFAQGASGPPAPNVAQGGSIAGNASPPLTGDLETDRKIIAQRESGGDPTALNWVAKADPSAYGRGATASGKYQFVNSTWQDGLKLAGLDPSKYPTAMSAPESVQDQVFTAVYKRDGTKPWDASTFKQNWVPTPTGQMVLANVVPGTKTAPATTAAPPAAPAPYKVASTGAMPPPPSSSSTAPAAATPAADDTFFPNAPPAATPVGNLGLVKNPDGSVGTPGGGFQPPTTPPTTVPPAAAAPQQTSQADQPPAPPAVTTPPPAAPLDIKSAPDTTLTPEQYVLKHWVPLKPEDVARYAPGPDNQLAVDRSRAVQQALADAQSARNAFLQARQMGSPDATKLFSAVNEADSRVDAAEKDYNTAVQGLKTEGARNLLAADDQQRQQLRADFKSIVTDPAQRAIELAQTAAENEKNRQAEAARLTQSGQQAIALEQAKGRTASEGKVMDAMNTTSDTARDAIQQLAIARALSRQAGDPTFWQTIQTSHPELVRALANMGGLGEDQVTQLGAAGALDAAVSKLTTMARSGSGFQRVTNADLQLLQTQAPKGTDPQQWREAKLAYLQSLMERQVRYADTVHSLVASGKNVYDAQKQADQEVPSSVPQMPNFQDTPQMSAADQRQGWYKGLSPNTFFRTPDGKRLILYAPPGS